MRRGEICIGCAGGGDSTIEMDIEYQSAPNDFLSFQLAVEGLKGGHSGVDIHEDRACKPALIQHATILMHPSQDAWRSGSQHGRQGNGNQDPERGGDHKETGIEGP